MFTVSKNAGQYSNPKKYLDTLETLKNEMSLHYVQV